MELNSSEFAGSRGTMLDDVSDGSMMSGEQSITSASDYSMMQSSLPPISSSRNRLSPVRENHTNEEKSTNVTPERVANSENIDSYFEMVTAVPTDSKRSDQSRRGALSGATLAVPGASSSSSPSTAVPLPSTSSTSMFARKPVPPARPGKSALTAMMATEDDDNMENPFTEFYSAISGRAEGESTEVQVYFPRAKQPAGKAMKLNVRKDATIEEVLGFALWTYWEEGWLPKIDEGLSGEDDPKWATVCSALGWILRIAEDDGEVDEDFPRKILAIMRSNKRKSNTSLSIAPDRTGKISKFNFDAYAVLEASPAQGIRSQADSSFLPY